MTPPGNLASTRALSLLALASLPALTPLAAASCANASSRDLFPDGGGGEGGSAGPSLGGGDGGAIGAHACTRCDDFPAGPIFEPGAPAGAPVPAQGMPVLLRRG